MTVKKNKSPRILFYDIEVSYTVGAVWGLYDQNVAGVIRDPYMLSFAYKWYGEKTTKVLSLPMMGGYNKNKKCDKKLVQELWKLFDEADIIIAHNGNSFDQKWAYSRFLLNGMKPPSPSKYIDTKIVAKSLFRFNSNSLNNLAKYFGIGSKVDTGGIDLWIDCIENDLSSAWRKMEVYNKMDVVLLEKVYLKMVPYIINHPNLNLYLDSRMNCPNCGVNKLIKHKLRFSRTGARQQYKCGDCGAYCTGEVIKKKSNEPLAR